MLQPVVRRTWSLKGQTPVFKHWQRHDRLSVISAITISPKRKSFNLFFESYQHNITSQDVLGFLQDLHETFPGKKIIIMDNWRVHKAKLISQFIAAHDSSISVEWLPAYSPELNPVEPVWSYSKYVRLANYSACDVTDLSAHVEDSLCEIKSKSQLLRSFFHKSGLVI